MKDGEEIEICSHPIASRSYSADYMPESGSYKPEFQYTERFRCYNCHFQDYIYTRYGLDEYETEFLYVLKNTLQGYQVRTDLIALLSELDIIAFAEFPATDEQKRDCLLPPLIKAQESLDRIAALGEFDDIES
ncbi:MAG TPA: hypothetical protein VK892_10410, partial [Pyrinomonadaceae bacterium]|nr:hypothetical protein [Pyrinomonadaceae bacterium]